MPRRCSFWDSMSGSPNWRTSDTTAWVLRWKRNASPSAFVWRVPLRNEVVMETPIFVHVDLQGHPRFVGRLWARSHKGKQSATFEYDSNWLEYAARFSLEPALEVGPGPFYTQPARALFGAMGDSAPDRWGRVLMQRSERMQARADGRNPHSLQEIDYLLNVNDESRQGALRFSRQEGGPFLSDSPQEIPPLLELPTLLAASEKLLAGEEGDENDHSALRLLLAPGSSLGGARPKASVRGPGG